MTEAARARAFSFLVLAATLGASSRASAEEPFEPEARASTSPPPPPAVRDGFRPVSDVLLALVRFYQTDIGAGSVSRCPFVVSCSAHATFALERYGIFGLPLFLDRYFFRENAGAYGHYDFVRTDDGTLRLDDAAFDLR